MGDNDLGLQPILRGPMVLGRPDRGGVDKARARGCCVGVDHGLRQNG